MTGNHEQEVYLDFSIEDERKGIISSSNNIDEDSFLFGDEFSWDDKLLECLFDSESTELKLKDQYENPPKDKLKQNSSKEKGSSSSTKRNTKSTKIVPQIESNKLKANSTYRNIDNEEDVSEEVFEKRAYWRKARREFLRKKLIVPDDDPRREYLKLFGYYYNSHQMNKLQEHLKQHSESELLFRQNLHQWKEDGNLLYYFMPSKVEIKGVENYVKYCKILIACNPDKTTYFSNVVIRNRFDGSTITADVVLEGTPTFHIMVKNMFRTAFTKTKKDDESDRKKQKFESDKVDDVVITDLSSSLDKVRIADDSCSTNKVDFSQGAIKNPKNMCTYKGTGTVRCHFSKDKKCYLVELDITKIEKTGNIHANTLSENSQTPSAKKTVYQWATNMTKFLQFKPRSTKEI